MSSLAEFQTDMFENPEDYLFYDEIDTFFNDNYYTNDIDDEDYDSDELLELEDEYDDWFENMDELEISSYIFEIYNNEDITPDEIYEAYSKGKRPIKLRKRYQKMMERKRNNEKTN